MEISVYQNLMVVIVTGDDGINGDATDGGETRSNQGGFDGDGSNGFNKDYDDENIGFGSGFGNGQDDVHLLNK